jgi:hypothetical protein
MPISNGIAQILPVYVEKHFAKKGRKWGVQGKIKRDIFVYEFDINLTDAQVEVPNLSKHIQLNRSYVELRPINNWNNKTSGGRKQKRNLSNRAHIIF